MERVTIRRDDGRLFRDVPISFFSDADRKFIRKWKQDQIAALDNADIQEDSKVRVTVGTGRDSDFNNYGDIDDQIVGFKPKVSFYNEETLETFTEVDCTLVYIGEHVLNSRVYSVMNKQQFTVDLPPREKIEWFGGEFQQRYDPDYAGYKYEGQTE